MASSPWNRGIYSMAINGKESMRALWFSLLFVGLATCLATAAAVDEQKPADRLPVTTSSASSARDFEYGMVNYEKHLWNLALNDWQQATRLELKFALAYT